jgi:TPR repeat protein
VAQVELGRIRSRGLGIASDQETALKWFSAAAAQEDKVFDREGLQEAKAYAASRGDAR